MTSRITRFVVGQTYHCRSLGDYDCVYSFEVVRRTEQFVWLKYWDKVTRRKVRPWTYGGAPCEACDPHGRYSLSPVLLATEISIDKAA